MKGINLSHILPKRLLPDGEPPPDGDAGEVIRRFHHGLDGLHGGLRSNQEIRRGLLEHRKAAVTSAEVQAVISSLLERRMIEVRPPPEPLGLSFGEGEAQKKQETLTSLTWYAATSLGRKAAAMLMSLMAPTTAYWLLGEDEVEEQVLLAMPVGFSWPIEQIDAACSTTPTDVVRNALDELERQGLIGRTGDRFALTDEGESQRAAALGTLDGCLRQVHRPLEVTARPSHPSGLSPADEGRPSRSSSTEGRPLRILHISDLHERVEFDGMPDWRNSVLRRDAAARGLVLGDGFYESLRDVAKGGVDLVCFTGDVADWAVPEEYAKATGRILKILETVGVGPDRLLLVPGNHDIEREVHKEAWNGIREWFGRTGNASDLGNWLVWGEKPPPGIDPGWREILQREEAFWRWSKDVGCTNIRPYESLPLGYRHTFPAATWPGIDVPVHIIGLDSAWLCGDDNDQGKILVTEEQVLAHVRDREHPLQGFRLALMHHPMSELAAVDQHGVWGLLADGGVDLLLHGHQHTPLAWTTSSPDASLRTLATGCLMEGKLGKNWPNGFQLIEVDVGAKSYTVHLRKWARDASPRFWAKGSDIYKDAPDGVLVWPPNDARIPQQHLSQGAEQAIVDPHEGPSWGNMDLLAFKQEQARLVERGSRLREEVAKHGDEPLVDLLTLALQAYVAETKPRRGESQNDLLARLRAFLGIAFQDSVIESGPRLEDQAGVYRAELVLDQKGQRATVELQVYRRWTQKAQRRAKGNVRRAMDAASAVCGFLVLLPAPDAVVEFYQQHNHVLVEPLDDGRYLVTIQAMPRDQAGSVG